MLAYDKTLNETMHSIQQGLTKVPDFMNECHVPSLWAYYETLPSWARNDSVIRNVMMAYEYHKPDVSLRDKETAMNFACSLLRPIEGTLQEVIADIANSHKVQLNMKLGNQMLNELQFYELDPETLGSESEEYEGDDEQKSAIVGTE